MDGGAWGGYSPWDCKESDTTEQACLLNCSGQKQGLLPLPGHGPPSLRAKPLLCLGIGLPPLQRPHLFRGRPWAALRARPQEGPRAPAAHPEAAPAAQLGASCCVSSFWVGGGLEPGWGEREARQFELPPRVLAPAALRSARRAAATGGPSSPRLRGPRHLPRGALEIHATSRPGAAGRATRAFR